LTSDPLGNGLELLALFFRQLLRTEVEWLIGVAPFLTARMRWVQEKAGGPR